MNLNVATTAFYKPGNLAQALDNYANSTYMANPTAFVKGLRVKTKHVSYTKMPFHCSEQFLILSNNRF